MKDHLLQTVVDTPMELRRNLAREYVQVYVLRLLHEMGGHRQLAFVGGTALRLLHRLPRFSEDLDFSCDDPEADSEFDAERIYRRLKDGLVKAGYEVGVKARLDRTVTHAFFRLEGLPRDLGFSIDPRLALTVKVEIDGRPPRGGFVETTLIQRFFPIALRHHDLPSLFAGKLHALLTRPWPKGRDWFDLVWYLTEKPDVEPNLELLKNALTQTGHQASPAARWRELLVERLESLQWSQVVDDLRPFVERPADLDQINTRLIKNLLKTS